MKRKWHGNWHYLLANYSGTKRFRQRLQEKPERQAARADVQERLLDAEGES